MKVYKNEKEVLRHFFQLVPNQQSCFIFYWYQYTAASAYFIDINTRLLLRISLISIHGCFRVFHWYQYTTASVYFIDINTRPLLCILLISIHDCFCVFYWYLYMHASVCFIDIDACFCVLLIPIPACFCFLLISIHGCFCMITREWVYKHIFLCASTATVCPLTKYIKTVYFSTSFSMHRIKSCEKFTQLPRKLRHCVSSITSW